MRVGGWVYVDVCVPLLGCIQARALQSSTRVGGCLVIWSRLAFRVCMCLRVGLSALEIARLFIPAPSHHYAQDQGEGAAGADLDPGR